MPETEERAPKQEREREQEQERDNPINTGETGEIITTGAEAAEPGAETAADEANGQASDTKEQDQERLTARLAELEAQLAEREAQISEYVNRIQHLQADFENYKKRIARELAERQRAIEDQVILEFIPIYDNLERAFASLELSSSDNKEAFIDGVERIFKQFQQVLDKLDVTRIAAQGARFDPAFHEAVLTVEHDGEPNIVLQELEPGYLRAGRLLRPSLVAVSKPRAEQKQREGEREGAETRDTTHENEPNRDRDSENTRDRMTETEQRERAKEGR